MRTICIVIGAIVVDAIFMAIPILFSISLCLKWDSFLSFLFMVGTLIEFGVMFELLLQKAGIY